MNTLLILFIIFFIIISIENPKFIATLLHNLGTIRGVITNLLFLIPLVTLFFSSSDIGTWLNERTSSNTNVILKDKWWSDPNKRKKYKKKQLRKVSESTKKIVASNQQWRCLMCHNLLDYSYEIDHNVPLFAGGTNDITNLHALCRNCHGKKTILERNQDISLY